MTLDQETPFTLGEAEKFLKTFTCVNVESIHSIEDRKKIRQALLIVVNASDYQMLGVCAPSLSVGLTALRAYLQGIGYKEPLGNPPANYEDEAVYIKFNTMKGTYYVDSYNGIYRGVLISCQSSFADGINGTFGHFPLDLF